MSLNFKKAREADISQIVTLHLQALPLGLVALIGAEFAEYLYEEILKDDLSFVLVAHEDKRVVGLAAGSANPSRLLSRLLKNPFRLMVLLLKRISRRPLLLKTLFQAFIYENKAGTDPTLLSLAVTENYRSLGMGRELINLVRLEFGKMGVQKYRVEVHQSNTGANHFYQRLGMKLEDKMKLYGYEWNVYYDYLEI